MRVTTALLLQAFLLGSASAQTIGLSIAEIDSVRSSIVAGVASASDAEGYKLVQAAAKNDVGTQLSDVKAMIDAGASALIVNGVNAKAEQGVADLAKAAKIPVVFVNHKPPADILVGQAVYVGSDEIESGTLQTEEVCRLLGGKGDITVLMGELSHPAARLRTSDVHAVLKTPECQGMRILEEQSGNWNREQAADITRVWLDGGLKLQAIIANNDEMALGALKALKEAGSPDIVVAGIDATDDALAAMVAGDLDVTVLQDAVGQGRTAVSLVGPLLRGEAVDPVHYVPFKLVTPADAPAMVAERSKS